MKTNTTTIKKTAGVTLALGLTAVISYHAALAQRQPPSEHKGVSVSSLGAIPEASMSAQIGLEGYKMQLREITVAPGGQIARHSHAGRPGLVWTLSGSWVEGRPGGERTYPDTLKEAILEDKDTEHWFFNDGNEPARVVVCDIVPDK